MAHPVRKHIVVGLSLADAQALAGGTKRAPAVRDRLNKALRGLSWIADIEAEMESLGLVG